MVMPASADVRTGLAAKAREHAMPVDGGLTDEHSPVHNELARMETVVAKPNFLAGVPADLVLDRLAKAGGDEVGSGKFASPESSSALAVNTFGWFIERPSLLPALPGMKTGASTLLVDVEYCARFPWRGGRHPWLDAVVETERELLGVESKRFEPFRDHKSPSLSKAYDRDVWGTNMGPFEAMRNALRTGQEKFEFLDATQLVKHAFGLVTDGARKSKAPVLVYLYAEPAALGARPITAAAFKQHRDEIARFGTAVAGADVGFYATSYREWLDTWPKPPNPVGIHREAVLDRFKP
jgi:hypothetical protein